MRTKAFTLIELLIVVAIIAILAAIAVPNFLEAQTRAKVSRSRNDMRVMATGLEAYVIDHNEYPSDCGNGAVAGMYRAYSAPGGGAPNWNVEPKANFTIGFELTTPIAYLSSAASLQDPFKIADAYKYTGNTSGRQYYTYGSFRYRQKLSTAATPPFVTTINRWGNYVIMGAGPDKYSNNIQGGLDFSNANSIPRGVNYDATNGTVSNGDLYRSQKFSGQTPEFIPLAPG